MKDYTVLSHHTPGFSVRIRQDWLPYLGHKKGKRWCKTSISKYDWMIIHKFGTRSLSTMIGYVSSSKLFLRYPIIVERFMQLYRQTKKSFHLTTSLFFNVSPNIFIPIPQPQPHRPGAFQWHFNESTSSNPTSTSGFRQSVLLVTNMFSNFCKSEIFVGGILDSMINFVSK